MGLHSHWFSLIIEIVTCMTYVSLAVSAWEWKKGSWNPVKSPAEDLMALKLLLVSILYFPRTVKWVILTICSDERQFMKLNVIMFAMWSGIYGEEVLQKPGVYGYRSSSGRNAGKQLTGRQTPSGKVPLSILVCILKSPSPASVTQTTGVFSLVHFFNVFTSSDEDSVLSCFSLPYPTSATCQNETSNWLKLWKTTFSLSQTNAKQQRMVFFM